jgi:hypothetical protein
MNVKNFFIMLVSLFKFVLNLSGFLILFSCGNGFDLEQEITHVSYSNEEYRAELKSHKKFSGFLKLSIIDSQLSLRVKLFGPPSDHQFLQVLHQKVSCPQLQEFQTVSWNDFNFRVDNFGKVQLFLDSLINHSLESIGPFPKMRRNGSYYFSRAADLRFLYPAGMRTPLSEMILIIYQYDSLDHDLVPVACGKIRSV